jgi:5-(carboxyamino)imidazole ribonucleotide synthase
MTMRVLQPGSSIGMLGGGQLGRMFALSARAMGYSVTVYSNDKVSPAAQVADKFICAPYENETALNAFAATVDVVTLEFENIPISAVKALAQRVPVYPGADTLYVAQNREREKQFLQDNGFPLAPFAVIKEASEIDAAIAHCKLPCVFKTAGFGYDGKGQKLVNTRAEANLAFAELSKSGSHIAVESFITIEKEFSVIGARNYQQGQSDFVSFGPIENKHVNHILDVSSIPARLDELVVAEAIEITRTIMEKLDTIGLLCVEFFLTSSGLLVNEMAPRPHNSGHLTIEACPTSQFEQQLRAVCGLKLGATTPFHSAAMVNLLGDIWYAAQKPDTDGMPDFAGALTVRQAHLHLYGKEEARVGRKMGHITTVAESSSLAIELALRARAALTL